jgi:hypothetical protein
MTTHKTVSVVMSLQFQHIASNVNKKGVSFNAFNMQKMEKSQSATMRALRSHF